MLEYLAVLLIGFWLGVAIFLYVSCYWLEEILDLPHQSARAAGSSNASSAHAQLKRLVARVVEEAAALPALARYAQEPLIPPESATYEDLLASAILNKVIERYQTENGSGGRSSGIHSASASPSPSDRSSPRTLNASSIREISPPPLNEEDVSDWEEGTAEDALAVKRVPFPEFGGDIVHQTDNDYRDIDEVSSSDIQAADGSWEENWLFQKKKLKTTQSVPVPMLVPNSNTEYKALIGDRDADDTTDLSDNASDAGEDEEEEYKSDVKKVLDFKHVIGGKQKVDDFDVEPDSLTIIEEADDLKNIKFNDFVRNDDMYDSIEYNNGGKFTQEKIEEVENDSNSILLMGVDCGPVHKAEFNLKEEIHRTMLNGHIEYPTDAAKSNGVDETNGYITKNHTNHNNEATNTLRSRHEREGEYEETVTVPVQRYADSLRRKHFEEEPEGLSSLDNDEELIPGSIADRERKKWLNYVDMPNNPYSPEAIKKRLTAKSTSSLFDMITSGKETSDSRATFEDYSRPSSNLEMDSLNDFEVRRKLSTSASMDQIGRSHSRSESPSPRVLKDVLSEEIPQYKRYGRDYYIKEARASSGGRASYSPSTASTASAADRAEFASPGLLIKQFNSIATNQHYTKFANKNDENISVTTIPNEYKNEILIEYEDANEQTLFPAKPTYIDDDTDRKFEEILETAYQTEVAPLKITHEKVVEESQKSPISVENSLTSSIEDTIKIYNVQTGEIVKCKPVDNVSPRYDTHVNDNIDKNSSEDDRLSDNSEEDIVFVNGSEGNKSEEETELRDLPTQLPSVKELAKKFTSMESLNEPVKPTHNIKRHKSKENMLDLDKPASKTVYMHSLTARSISREFREELKLSMATPLTVPGGSKEIPDGAEEVIKESSRPGSPLPEPGTIKTKLAFFESLKTKFSNK